MARTLVLGAGFGGISVARELSRLLGTEAGPGHEIVLIDHSPHFMMGLRKLWALVGIGTLEEGARPRSKLSIPGARFVQESIVRIDPAKREVATTASTLSGDHLVIALGAEPRADLVPGLIEHGHNLYDADAIPKLAEAIAGFTGGRIVILVAGAPYKCPPAPYEFSMLLDEHLRDRKIHDRSEVVVATVQPMLMPNAGRPGSEWLARQLDARGIQYRISQKLERISAGKVVFADGVLEADLIIGVPPHRVPSVVTSSRLASEGGWIQVDPGTLETAHPGVFAIGDVVAIKLANGLPLPKAGLMAELQGRSAASVIASRENASIQPALFDGQGFCYVEMGRASAARIDGQFYAEPEPQITFRDPAAANAEEKHRFEQERLAAWFGD